MSVWRIKNVDGDTRSRADAAAEKAGIPLGAWLEQAIMRRVNVAQTGDSGAAPIAAAASQAAPAENDTASVGEDKAGKKKPALAKKRTRKRQTKAGASAVPAASSVAAEVAFSDNAVPAGAPVATSAEASAPVADGMATSLPVFVAREETQQTPAIAAVDDPADALPPPDETPSDASSLMPDEQPETPVAIFAEPEEEAAVVAPTRVPLTASVPLQRRGAAHRFSPLPIIAIGGVIAIVAIGGYFLFDENDSDSPTTAAQNPPAVASTTPDKPTAAVTPTPPTPSTPNPPAAPAPAPNSNAANPPSPATRPTGIPAPTPGAMPSLLMPVPGSAGDQPPSVAIAPPGQDFPTRPGPVVAQKDNIVGLTTRAEAGDVDAEIELGKRYMQGTGTAKNPAEALRWLEKAAEAGNGQAQFNVAVMYERGIGTAADPVKAIAWYRKAAAQTVPVPMAIHNLALLYVNGSPGLPADAVQARILMTQSAELGLPESQYSLALMYFQGVGGSPDKIGALSWLALAARTNDPQLVQAAQQLANSMTPDEKTKAELLANQHVKRINDNIARLRTIATSNTPAANPPAAPTTPSGKPLDRASIAEIQRLLAVLKLFSGPPDGATGAKTEQAIRDYQTMAGLPVDGKATAELLTNLRDVAGAVGPKSDDKKP